MSIIRRKTREVKIGNLIIGGNNPIRVQSMCKIKTSRVKEIISQIGELEESGCEIIRVSVKDMDDAKSLKEIKKSISMPLVADIHFDHNLALASIPHIDKLRINPGNIGSIEKIKKVVNAAKDYGVPIRIGVNSGSIEKEIKEKFGNGSNALVESAIKHVKILESLNFFNTIIALKSSDVLSTVAAYREFSKRYDYPLHLGITEAGTNFSGSIKSSVGLGIILSEGIGDTIRVSLTSSPVDEVRAGYEILKSLGLRKHGAEIISCPTCGRAEPDFIKIASEIESELSKIDKPIKIAIMGCPVNGIGEAKVADIGVAFQGNSALIFSKGKILKRIKKEEIKDEIKKIASKI